MYPFLAVPPTLEQLYFVADKTYSTPSPYAKIYGYNLNPLTYTLTQRQPSVPSILTKNHKFLFSEQLPFRNTEVAAYIQNNLELLSKHSDKYIEFKEASVGIPIKKTIIGICFNGRQTPGGHNIIMALLAGGNTRVIGFIDGTKGMFRGDHI